jgi:hypothetical protein
VDRVHGCGPRKGGRSTGPPWTSQGPATGAHLADTLEHDDFLRRHWRQAGDAGTLAVGSPWAERRRGGLAAVESRARWRCSVCEVVKERRVGATWCGEVEAGAALYMLGWVGETAGEAGNGRWRCGLKVVS